MPAHRTVPARFRRIAAIARRATLLGLAVVLLLPAARAHNQWLGWLSMWLVAMPASAWWAASGFRLATAEPVREGLRRLRRTRPQARRVGLRGRASGLQRVA